MKSQTRRKVPEKSAAKHKTLPPKQNEIPELLQRIKDYKPAKETFSYAERGQAVTKLHQLHNEAFELRKRFPGDAELSEASTKLLRLWYAAIDAAYPSGFWEDCQKLQAGDTAGLESAVGFLEADPIFFRSGYVKASLMRWIKPSMLTPNFATRLQDVVLSLVDCRDDRDFRAYCRLARKVDAPKLRGKLASRLTSHDPNIQRRARWVLEALEKKDKMGKPPGPQ